MIKSTEMQEFMLISNIPLSIYFSIILLKKKCYFER